MLPTTVAKYVLETWEDLRKLQEEFKKAMFENAIAKFSTITAVDRLDITIRLDTIRSIARPNKLPVRKGMNATTTNKETDELRSGDRFGKDGRHAEVAYRTRANDDSNESDERYAQQTHQWRETMRGAN